MRTASVLALLAFVALALLGVAPAVRAQEVCSGCKGQGAITCGRCQWPNIGRCSTCGPMSLTPPRAGERCSACYGSGVCPGCNGKGITCLACKGSGQLPAGASRPALSPEQTAAAIQQALQPFSTIVGKPLVEEGEDAQRGKFTTQLRIDPRLGGTFLRCDYTMTYADGSASEGSWMLTFEPASRRYVLMAFSAPGQVTVLRGEVSGDDSVVFALEGARMTWTLRGDVLESTIEVKNAEGWARASRGVTRPAR